MNDVRNVLDLITLIICEIYDSGFGGVGSMHKLILAYQWRNW